MPDVVMHEIRSLRRRDFRNACRDRRASIRELAGPSGNPVRARGGPASSPDTQPEPVRGGLGRRLLDAIVISFAYGGCIHNIHPHYVDFLRELSRTREG